MAPSSGNIASQYGNLISTTTFSLEEIMKTFFRIFCVVLTVSSFGAVSNATAAQMDSDCRNGMGPGMMGGYGPGSGMNPEMMGGYGPGYGMGSGMMRWGNFRELNLSAEQQSRISQVRQEVRTKQWAIMGKMMDAQDKLQELFDTDKQDSAAINDQYKAIDDLRRQMVDNSVDAHNRINGILTKEQIEKLRASSPR